MLERMIAMSDLISKEALFDAFEEAQWFDNDDRDCIAERLLEDAPTIDALPVVHCKDCRYLSVKDLGNGYCKRKMSGPISPYDFCSYGEDRHE